MRPVHLVVPEGVDDALRASGGNIYDRRVADALRARGRPVVEHEVAGGWPTPDHAAEERLTGVLAAVPDGEQVLVDGLVASASAAVVVPASARLSLAVLVHLPLGVETPATRPAERDVLRAASSVIATSGWTCRWLTRHYGLADVRVARPGADAAPVAAGSGTGRALLCVGRASAAKGYDVLAAALCAITDLDWSCTWVGPVEHPLRGPVALTGPLPPAALEEHYAAADLLVLPSRTETYGMVLAEALARGVPVLASDVGGVREAVGTTATGELPGLLVPPGDPGALAAALRRWLTDARLRARLRERALERRETLVGWDATAAEIAAALRAPLRARS